jgi:histidyl-tRNA synthetase
MWKNLYYDAEILVVISETLWQIVDRFFGKKDFTLHINNRYLLWGFFSQFDESKRPQLYNLLDKYYKIWAEEFAKQLEDLLSPTEVKKVIDFTKSDFKHLSLGLVDNAEYRRWFQELQEVLTYVNALNKDNKYKIVWDPCIIRWLDYYTGTVYEAYFDDDMWLGSISWWWRYENLTWYINPKKSDYSWVWGTIWLSRIVYLILENINPELKTQTEYLFLNFSDTKVETLGLMKDFLSRWHSVEYYPAPDKLGKQFAYADKKWIPNVIIFGDWELKDWIYKIKNMNTGEESIQKI